MIFSRMVFPGSSDMEVQLPPQGEPFLRMASSQFMLQSTASQEAVGGSVREFRNLGVPPAVTGASRSRLRKRGQVRCLDSENRRCPRLAGETPALGSLLRR